MNATTFTYLWIAVLAFAGGWGSARLKDCFEWVWSKRRRGMYGGDWGCP